MNRSGIIIACLVVAGGVVGLLAGQVQPRNRKSTTSCRAAVRSIVQQSSASAPSASGGEKNTNPMGYALGTFRSLITPPLTPDERGPVWQYWFTKCDLGLESDCPSADTASAEIGGICAEYETARGGDQMVRILNSHRLRLMAERGPSQSIVGGMEKPQQAGVVDRLSGAVAKGSKSPHRPPLELASVLFNEHAACSIWRIQQRDPHGSLTSELKRLWTDRDHQVLPEMDAGSIIIKTIWESAFQTPGQMVTDGVPVFDQGVFTARLRMNMARKNNNLGTPLLWPYVIAVDTGSQDQSCAGPSSDNSFPASCFFLIKLDKSESKKLNQQTAHLIFPDGADGSAQYAVLVGLNIMELETQFPDWIWSSFWWTKQTNTKLLDDLPQWKHFSVCAVDEPRSATVPGPSPESDSSVCFNPYLEGAKSWNGIISNCLSCHQFAAYRPRTTGLATTQDIGTCLGLPDQQNRTGQPTGNGSLTPCKQAPAIYRQSSLSTRFLWSVGNVK